MSLRRTLIIAFLLALLIPTSLAILSGCDSTPEAPVYDNPFDPDGANGGDPFDLIATLGDTNITLVWNNIADYDLASYKVLHSLSYQGEFSELGIVEVPELAVATFNYEDPDPTSTHYFKIQAYDSQGYYTLTSHIVPASATTLARVVIDEGSGKLESRHINIRINVTTGDSLRINQSGHPDSEVVLAADDTGAPVSLPWDLGLVDSNDTTLTISVAVQNGNTLGEANDVELDVDFTPTLTLSQGGTKVAHLFPPLTISSDAVIAMRFSDTSEGLAELPWLAGGTEYAGFELANTVNRQFIFAEFLSDFGFSFTRQLYVKADLMDDATFSLVLSSDHISEVRTIKALSNANATQMRFNESLDFTNTPWVAYSDTTTIILSPESGEKTIYAQYRNDFADSPIYTDYVVHLLQPVEVSITAPFEGDFVPGGQVFQILGTALSPSAIDTVTLVEFDGGDGFVDVVGTENWAVAWDVPRFEADTDFTIRARAWAGTESMTTTMNVVVTQLVVGITTPAEGDTLVSGSNVEISGVAFASAMGAAVDSVVVEIDGDSGVAEGTGPWTYDWVVGAVAEETEVLVFATVFAGSTQQSTQTQILITP